jgi:DNA-binding response OmpR family regulator
MMILERNGFRVLVADSPAAAKRIWANQRAAIDLLLVDISMPAISGPELVLQLLSEGPPIPVIFATGTGEEQARIATQNILRPTILQKPFTQDLLIETINDALGRHAQPTR